MRLWRHKTADEFIGILFFGFLLLVFAVSSRAALVTAASDTLSRGKVGVQSNHDIVFVTPSGIAEGMTATVTFPPAFSAVGMTEDDVDFFDNGVPVTTAPDCSGNEQMAAIWAGNTLSLQVCAGDGGAVGAGATVEIMIGTNAVDSGVGASRIYNPASAGSYKIAIGGSFGDSGFAPVPIALNDEVGITACVGDCVVVPPTLPVEPVLGGSTASAQTPPPKVTGVVIDQITATSARVSWQTDIYSNTYALYGLTTDYGGVAGKEEKTGTHSVTIMGLGSGYIYHVKARSMGYFGDVGFSTDLTFSTLPTQNATQPKISNIRLEEISGESATIAWNTTPATWSRIEFGRTANYGSVIEEQSFDASHVLTLENLEPDTQYHYRIISVDEGGTQTVSADYVFKTFDTNPPKISLIHTGNLRSGSFDVIWTTDKPTTGGVKYGQSLSYEGGESLEPYGFSIIHRVAVSNLVANTEYHFKIFASDNFGNDSESADQSVVTKADAIPPANAQDFSAEATDQNISLYWTNPTDPDFAKAIIVRKAGGYPGSLDDGVKIYDGAGNNYIDAKAVSGETYYYAIWTFDRSGNASSGALAAASIGLAGSAEPTPLVPLTAPKSATVFGSASSSIKVDGVPQAIVNDSVTAYSQSNIHLELPIATKDKSVDSAYVRIDGSEYRLIAGANGVLATDFLAPIKLGQNPASAIVNYADGSTAYGQWQVDVLPVGQVTEKEGDAILPVSGATITIYSGNKVWDGSSYGENNPQYSDNNGHYRLVVPRGIYSIKVEKYGYKTVNIDRKSYNGVINEATNLVRQTGTELDSNNNLLNKGNNSSFISLVGGGIFLFFGLGWWIFLVFKRRKRKKKDEYLKKS